MGFRNPVRSLRADQITPGALPAGVTLPNGSVTTPTIALGAITTPAIAAGAITAALLSADAIDGKVITGATLRTAVSGQRVVLYTGGLIAYNAANAAVTTISAATGALTATGATLTNVSVSGSINGLLITDDDIGGWRAQLAPGLVSIEKASVVGLRMRANYLESDGAINIQGLGDIDVISSGGIYLGAGATVEFAGTSIVSTTIRDATLATGAFTGPVGVNATGKLGRITGTLATAQIPALDASKVASGTLDVGRIPFVSGGATFVRLFTGTDDSVGYNFRVTGTPLAGIYDGTTAMFYVSGASGQVYSPPSYANSISTRALYISSTGQLGTTSSLRAHKCAIEPVDATVVDALLELRPVTFLRVADLDGPREPRREVGLIAEEAVAAGMPTEFLYLSDAGALEGVAYERLPVYLVTAFQHLHARIAQLEGAAA